jgi:hypothetical protein
MLILTFIFIIHTMPQNCCFVSGQSIIPLILDTFRLMEKNLEMLKMLTYGEKVTRLTWLGIDRQSNNNIMATFSKSDSHRAWDDSPLTITKQLMRGHQDFLKQRQCSRLGKTCSFHIIECVF